MNTVTQDSNQDYQLPTVSKVETQTEENAQEVETQEEEDDESDDEEEDSLMVEFKEGTLTIPMRLFGHHCILHRETETTTFQVYLADDDKYDNPLTEIDGHKFVLSSSLYTWDDGYFSEDEDDDFDHYEMDDSGAFVRGERVRVVEYKFDSFDSSDVRQVVKYECDQYSGTLLVDSTIHGHECRWKVRVYQDEAAIDDRSEIYNIYVDEHHIGYAPKFALETMMNYKFTVRRDGATWDHGDSVWHISLN